MGNFLPAETHCNNVGRYAEAPPPSDSLGQVLDPAPGGWSMSEQVMAMLMMMMVMLMNMMMMCA